jgi:transposase
MDTNLLFTMALGLQAPWEVVDLQFHEEAHRLDILIDFKRGSDFPCPVCGQPCKVHDTVEKTWRHMNFFQYAAYLTARVPRCHCDKDGTKQVDVPWARPGSGFTLMFEALLMTLVQAMPVNAVARLVGEQDTRIWRLVNHHVEDARSRVDMSEVARIGVDETGAKRGQKYITLVVDMEAKKLLFAVEGKDQETLKAFRGDLVAHGGEPLKITEASIDMSQAFIKGLGDHFPNAHLTFDRFHVMKLLGEAVDEVRRQEVKDYPYLRKTRYVWLKNPSNLTAHQAEMLETLRNANLMTAEAYRMRLTLQDFYEQANPQAAKVFLDEWIDMVLASGIEPMIKAAQTIQAHAEGVLRWFRSGLSNGFLEGLNSLIKAAKAKARGYRNIQSLITVAYLIAGKLKFKVAELWPPAPPKAVLRPPAAARFRPSPVLS